MASETARTEMDLWLARLATARAGVYAGLLSLSETTLTAQPAAEAWTPKDVLAHLAFWDNYRAEQLEVMLAGRALELEPLSEPDTLNAQTYAERRDWSLDRVLDRVLGGRSRFLALLAGLSDADLDRRFEWSGGYAVTVREWIARRPRHDEGHIAPVMAWRREARPYEPGPKRLLALALNATQEAVVAWQTALTETEQTGRPIIGTWTYQDVLGHLADWEEWFVRGLRDMAAGQAGGADFVRDYASDCQRWNEAHAAARQGEPLAKTLADFTIRRQELLMLLEAYGEAQLAAPAQTAVEGMDRVYFWFAGAADHEFEHAQMLAAALDGA